MATIELVTKFLPYVDEQFKAESKLELLTNRDFSWVGAHTIRIYTITTAPMHDYDRPGANTAVNWSRFGPVESLDATTQEMTLTRDRSFTFCIDKLDTDETGLQLEAASALARQNRERCIPEIDRFCYGKIVDGAGTVYEVDEGIVTSPDMIYAEILRASEALDNHEIPETNRTLLVTPSIYATMKLSNGISIDPGIGEAARIRGVIGMLDGANVVKVPASRLPDGVAFVLCHKSAAVAPLKLEDFRIHTDPPGLSGSLVEGRLAYDCFILNNKRMGIYVCKTATA